MRDCGLWGFVLKSSLGIEGLGFAVCSASGTFGRMVCAHSEAWPQDNRRREGSESQVMAG